MNTQLTFVQVVQTQLQKQIANYVKSNPQIDESNLNSITSLNIPIDEIIKNQKLALQLLIFAAIEGKQFFINFKLKLKKQAIKLEDLRSLSDLKNANGQLVEFTYMIQGMFNPEMYAMAAIDVKLVKQGNVDQAIEVFKFHDTMTSQEIPNTNQNEFNQDITSALGDRYIYYAIPIPNQNKWTQQQVNSSDIDIEDEINLEKSTFTYKGVSVSTTSDINTYANKFQELGLFNYECNKATNHTFPCILKYYNEDPTQRPKLNQIVKVKGILSYVLPEVNEEIEEIDQEELFESFDKTSFIYPERFIPRVHVLKSETLSYKDLYQESLQTIEQLNSSSSSEEQRQHLLQDLTQILGNDSLSAFYLLMSLLSSTNLTKVEKKYGSLFLNLLNTSQKLSSGAQISVALNEYLQQILMYSVSVPLSLKYLNTQNIAPQSDNTGKIQFGVCQLPKEAKHYLICDETQMEQGELDQKGFSNIRAFISFFENLQIPFGSEFYQRAVDADVSGVILSEGKGLLYKDIQIKLEEDLQFQANLANQEFNLSTNNQELLNQIRKYILESKNLALTVQLNADVANSIQTDFVEKRKQQATGGDLKKEETISQESLEIWIQLSRLNAASKLKQVATIEDYLEIKKYEETRIKRNMKEYQQGQ